MIIFGVRGITMTRDEGFFDCPDCQRSTEYRLRGVRNFFTLYFIPVIPLNWEPGNEHVRCEQCRQQFPPGALDGTWPADDATELEGFGWLVRRFALVPMLVAGGVIRESDKQRLKAICLEDPDGHIDMDMLDQEIQQVRKAGVEASMEILSVVARTMVDHRKSELITAAWRLAEADGGPDPAQWKVLAGLGEAMNMSAEQIDAVIADAEVTYGQREP